MSLSETCIYTIAHGTKLASAAERNKPTTFLETKPWVTGLRLWRQATDNDLRMPIVFADAADCSELIYWGILSDVSIDKRSTEYAVSQLQRIQGRRTPQQLRLKSTGKPIAANFIRPYAICLTPEFLRD